MTAPSNPWGESHRRTGLSGKSLAAGSVEDEPQHGRVADGEAMDVATGHTPSRTLDLRKFKNKAKGKTRNIFHRNADTDVDADDIQGSIHRNPAFNPRILAKQQKQEQATSPAKVLDTVKSIRSNIAHPKQAVKDKATRTTAGRLSKRHRPFLSQRADAEFLRAYEELENTESTRTSRHASSDPDSTDSACVHHRQKIERMKAKREGLKIAWTTSRHITRVRVTPKRQWPYPDRSAYMKNDGNGTDARFDWLPWLGQLVVWYTQDFAAQYIEPSNSPSFELDTLKHHVERIAVVSAPWQAWLMKVRSVYRWEDPKVTGRWFAFFLFLWYTNHVLSFLYAYIIYMVLRNRFSPRSIESLRAAQQRAQEQGRKALKISELIDKHGNDNWLEPLARDLGPFAQLELNDVANLLEILQNFYHWASPRKTAATLGFFCTCLLVSLFADLAFCMKIFWAISGGVFFLCWPIASRYPRYRLLVSPINWVFWGVPTDAEWSFMCLRREAQVKREGLIDRKVEREFVNAEGSVKPKTYAGRFAPIPIIAGEDEDHHPLPMNEDDLASDSDSYYSVDSATSICDGETFLTFRCTHRGFPGRFGISSSSISFTSRFQKGDNWTRSFLSLVEMQKQAGSKLKQVPVSRSTDVLKFTFTDGTSATLKAIKGRDEAFNAVIGFSAIQWQNLQPEA